MHTTVFVRSLLLPFRLPMVCLATLCCAIGIHEFGHAVAAWLTGGKVVAVVLLAAVPHIRVFGVGSPEVEALRAAGGSGLVYAVTFLLLLFGGWNRSLVIRTFSLFAMVECIGWVTSSLFPDSTPNDASSFITHSGLSGVLVATYCTAITALCISLVIIRWSFRPKTHLDALIIPASGASNA